MTRGRNKIPKEIICERCGKTALWLGGRKRRYCSPTCAHGKRNNNKPRPPKSDKSLGQRHTEQSRKLKIERGNCADCGLIITDLNVVCIDWDHRDPINKSFTISYYMGRIKWATIEHEINKCDAVCRNCHALRTHHGKHWQNKTNQQTFSRGTKCQAVKPPPNTEPQEPHYSQQTPPATGADNQPPKQTT